MRCKHKNITLWEHVGVSTSFHFTDGKPPKDGIGWSEDPQPTGSISVDCRDCGFEKTYRHYTCGPKWVRDAWERLMDEQYKRSEVR